eukprot:5559810-Pyramimonas_sp.AAC.1
MGVECALAVIGTGGPAMKRSSVIASVGRAVPVFRRANRIDQDGNATGGTTPYRQVPGRLHAPQRGRRLPPAGALRAPDRSPPAPLLAGAWTTSRTTTWTPPATCWSAAGASSSAPPRQACGRATCWTSCGGSRRPRTWTRDR